jgi:hypothetical protein
MERQNQQTLPQFTAARSHLCYETNVAATHFYLDIGDRIANWVQSYTAQEPDHIWDVFTGDAQTRLVKELTTYLTEQLQCEFQVWVYSTLQPLLYDGLRTVTRDMSRKTEQLLWQGARNAEDIGEDVETIIQDAVTRIVTAVVRYERFVWHPLVLITRLLEMASIQEGMRGSAGQEKMRNAVAWAYTRELTVTLQRRVSAIVSIVDEEIGKVRKKLSSTSSLLLQWARANAQGLVVERQQEQSREDRKMLLLTALEEELYAIDHELDRMG